MGIWERLGNVVKSYLHDEREIPRRNSGGRYAGARRTEGQGDPDLDAAYEELDEFLGGGSEEPNGAKSRKERAKPVPEEFLKDFAELGLAPGASREECKAAYKTLLKIHHPDRHAANPEQTKKATEKTARITTAYRRLEKWFRAAK